MVLLYGIRHRQPNISARPVGEGPRWGSGMLSLWAWSSARSPPSAPTPGPYSSVHPVLYGFIPCGVRGISPWCATGRPATLPMLYTTLMTERFNNV